jgi:hypothetical protein
MSTFEDASSTFDDALSTFDDALSTFDDDLARRGVTKLDSAVRKLPSCWRGAESVNASAVGELQSTPRSTISSEAFLPLIIPRGLYVSIVQQLYCFRQRMKKNCVPPSVDLHLFLHLSTVRSSPSSICNLVVSGECPLVPGGSERLDVIPTS